MNKSVNNEKEMQIIYDTAKNIYDGMYSVEYAISLLDGKVEATTSMLKTYFAIYYSMRKGTYYKTGTFEPFTKYILNKIYNDFGKDDYMKALITVKSNYKYQKNVNNVQSELIRVCTESMKECGVNLLFDDIPEADFFQYNDDMLYGRCPKITNGSGKTEKKYIDEPKVEYALFNGNTIELNIQPAASILNVFSRLSYKPWYAIAEFVDNSTQSYITHCNILDTVPEFDKLIVSINYNTEKNTLRIVDNAYGMEIERFRDAILLDSKNETQVGRNEFGMGLKTAASWFGNIWSVTSTQYGSKNRYSAIINIPSLKEKGTNSIQIHRDYVDEKEHGTEILIEQVTKKITASRTIGKIRDLLSSMYRRDINNKNIEIWFNNEPIAFEEYSVLTFRDKMWKKELDFDVEFNGQIYKVTGFVAIMNPGSFTKAGFALFRQDRVVVGGSDSNYKPYQIFGQAQSQRSLKLFGELNMNDFPVNQAKDGFIWDDGLEDAFIDVLKINIQEYIDIADISTKERATEEQYSPKVSNELQRDVAEVLEKAFLNDNESKCIEDINKNTILDEEETTKEKSDKQEYIDTILNGPTEEKMVGTEREYNIPINPVNNVNFSVKWAVGKKSFWIEYESPKQDTYKVTINIDHPFFMPFSKDEKFKCLLEKFTIAFILSERQAKMASDKDGYILSSTIKNYMNQYLQKLAEEK